MKKISIIIPFYNERDNLPHIYKELQDVRERLKSSYSFEIILMDNHSSDGSFEVAKQLAVNDRSVRTVRLSRNFGYQANILTGYLLSTGDAVIQLDADGEDDPSLIPNMISLWEQGNKVVYGVRKKRVESTLLTAQRKIFYKLVNSLSDIDIPADAGDFRLLDREVVEQLKLFNENHLYIRGLISYIGYKQVGFDYERRARKSGERKFSWFDYVRLAWDGISSFSTRPLSLAALFGFILSVLSVAGVIFYVLLFYIKGRAVPGFYTMAMLLLLVIGIQSIFIGLLGTYVGKIYEEVKSRPRSIIEESFPKE